MINVEGKRTKRPGAGYVRVISSTPLTEESDTHSSKVTSLDRRCLKVICNAVVGK